jgi:plastocyanin
MRRLPALSLTLVAVLALAACSAGGAPAWTYAPAPSTTPAPSGAASAEPTAATSAGVSAAPSSVASAAPSASAGESAGASAGAGAGLTVKAPEGAATGGFDPTTLETAANAAFSLTFDNEDSQAPHNLVLENPDGSPVSVTGDSTDPFQGPGKKTYQVPALTAGAYKYICQIHPTSMTGTLTVQ